MLAFPSAVKTRAATPGVPRIPSPTAATIATGRSTAIFSTSWRCSSALNIRSSALFKRSVASSGTTRQIEFSLDDWLIIITDTRSAHVGVDPKVVGLRGRGEHGRRIVRSAAPERCGHAVGRGTDEAGNHGYDAVAEAG